MVKERRQLLLFCFVLYLLVMLPFLSQHKMSLILLGWGHLFLVGFFEWRGLGWPKGLLGLLVIFSMILAASLFGRITGLEAGINFLGLLAALKCHELNTRRDFYVYIVILQLLFTGHLLSTDALSTVLYIIFVCLCMFYGMFRFHQLETIEYKKLGGMSSSLWYALPFAFLMFFVFPRVNLGRYFASNFKQDSKTGFSNRLRPGEVSQLAQSDEPIFRVQFSGPQPLRHDLYWRGGILAKTTGFEWDRVRYTSLERERTSSNQVQFSYHQSYTTLEHSHAFLLKGINHIQTLSDAKLFDGAFGVKRILPLSNEKIRINVRNQKYKKRELSGHERGLFTQLPERVNTRLKRFADQFKEKHHGDKESRLVSALMDHFTTQGYRYSLRPGAYPGTNGINTFFFERKIGFCEHYAAVTALLFRLWGIPSRVVTGFQGGLYNDLGDYYMVNAKDAHAWVEIHLAGEGWIRVDPVLAIAPSRIEYGGQEYFQTEEQTDPQQVRREIQSNQGKFFRRLWLVADMMYFELNQKFLGYDFNQQKEWLKSLGLGVKRPWQLLLIFLAAVIGLFVATWMVILFRSRSRDPIEYWYQRLLKALATKLPPKPSWEGGLDYFNRFRHRSEMSPELYQLIRQYNNIQYNPSAPGSERQDFIGRVKSFVKTFK